MTEPAASALDDRTTDHEHDERTALLLGGRSGSLGRPAALLLGTRRSAPSHPPAHCCVRFLCSTLSRLAARSRGRLASIVERSRHAVTSAALGSERGEPGGPFFGVRPSLGVDGYASRSPASPDRRPLDERGGRAAGHPALDCSRARSARGSSRAARRASLAFHSRSARRGDHAAGRPGRVEASKWALRPSSATPQRYSGTTRPSS